MRNQVAKRIVHIFEWLLYIGGFLFVILGVLFISFQGVLPTLFPQYPALAKMHGAFGTVTGLMLIVWGTAGFWIGHGFHHYNNHSRIAFIVLSLLLFLGALAGSYTTKTQFWLFGLLAVLQVWLFTFQREVVILFKPYKAPKPTLAIHRRDS